MTKQVFEIVGSPVTGNPLALLHERDARNEKYNVAQDYITNYTLQRGNTPRVAKVETMSSQEVYDNLACPAKGSWINELTTYLEETGSPVQQVMPTGTYFEDTSDRLSDEFISSFYEEIKAAFGNMDGVNVRFMTFDENGDPVELN